MSFSAQCWRGLPPKRRHRRLLHHEKPLRVNGFELTSLVSVPLLIVFAIDTHGTISAIDVIIASDARDG
jgi:hypothetical protein